MRGIPERGAPLAPPTCFSQGRVMKSTCSSATLLSAFTFPNGKGTTYVATCYLWMYVGTLVGEFFKAKLCRRNFNNPGEIGKSYSILTCRSSAELIPATKWDKLAGLYYTLNTGMWVNRNYKRR